jgi:hypothetical protein
MFVVSWRTPGKLYHHFTIDIAFQVQIQAGIRRALCHIVPSKSAGPSLGHVGVR